MYRIYYPLSYPLWSLSWIFKSFWWCAISGRSNFPPMRAQHCMKSRAVIGWNLAHLDLAHHENDLKIQLSRRAICKQYNIFCRDECIVNTSLSQFLYIHPSFYLCFHRPPSSDLVFKTIFLDIDRYDWIGYDKGIIYQFLKAKLFYN